MSWVPDTGNPSMKFVLVYSNTPVQRVIASDPETPAIHSPFVVPIARRRLSADSVISTLLCLFVVRDGNYRQITHPISSECRPQDRASA